MRVLHVAVTAERRRGGTTQAAFTLARISRRMGIDAEIAAVEDRAAGHPLITDEFPDVPVRLFPISFPKRFTQSVQLGNWLRDNVRSYDLVEVHEIFTFPPVHAAAACRRGGTPYLLNTHGGLFASDLEKRKLLKALFRRPVLLPMLRDAAVLKTATQLEADEMITYGVCTRKAVLPLPVLAPAAGADGARFRRRHGIADGDIVALFMGRLDPVKNIDLLIAGTAAARKREPRLKLVIAGSGDAAFEAKIRGWVKEHDAAEFVMFPGFITGADKADAYAAAQIYAQFSARENFSYTVADALAAGVPCLLSDRIGLAGPAGRAGAGLIVAPDLEQVIAGFEALLGRKAEWNVMAAAGRRLFARELSEPAAATALSALYNSISRRAHAT
jgi:glycosyltransferase involved in cell wall biosynthesis